MFTLISHFRNEEFLMPMWVKHHREFFPNAVLVDYHSDDMSVDIIRKLAPSWSIVTSANRTFDALKADQEIMDIEASVRGAKVVINTTDFLQLGSRDISLIKSKLESLEDFGLAIPGVIAVQAKKNLLERDRLHASNTAAAITACIYDKGKQKIVENDTARISRLAKAYEYFQNGYIREVGNPRIRTKLLHSFKSGQYWVGRHSWEVPATPAVDSTAVHLGMYPWNHSFVERKLAMRKAVPKRDLLRGRGLQHTLTYDKWTRALNFWRNEIAMHDCEDCSAVQSQISFLENYFGKNR